ncbi:MAG: hypothetical protein HPY59_04680 [Anaerolineae bacterium]|nr:hypothetical protein [Anaerolineae bacterium]
MTSKLALNKAQLYTLARQNSKCSFALQDARHALFGVLALKGYLQFRQ